MNQSEFIVDLLKRSLGMVTMTIEDFTEKDLVDRPVTQANNVAWQLGHLITSEAHMINACAGKEVVSLPADFSKKFDKENATTNDISKLASKAELVAMAEKVRNQTIGWVKTLSDTDLAKPGPESMRDWCPTVAHLLHLLPSHASMHIGQFQVLRRKLGRPVMF